jgi:GNAT superfamily N-acetyltransferase
MSHEHAWVAEVQGGVAGVAVGFPASARYRMHLTLLRRAAGYLPASRWLLVPPALGWLAVAAPRPPRDALYVAALAVSPRYFRRGVATALFDAMRRHAIENGYPKLAGHTGERHAPMRAAAERYGFQAVRARSWGYVLYVMELGP